jgi:copper homeostasis protein
MGGGTMINGVTIEICCGSLQDVETADAFPVDRMELNCALELDGLTPSLAVLMKARALTAKKIVCMVRPRPAGFCYSMLEWETMTADAKIFLEHGADGIVFGCLKADGSIDAERVKAMTALIHGAGREAVFHKAFDVSRDLEESMKTLTACGVDRVLTSGGGVYPDLDLERLADLNRRYGGRIQILPGGGIRPDNIRKVLAATGLHAVHLSAKMPVQDNGSYYAVNAGRLADTLAQLQPVPAASVHRDYITGEDAEMLENDPYENSLDPYGTDHSL